MTPPLFIADPARLATTSPGDVVRLEGAEGRHAALVRRLRPGELVALTDGAGQFVQGTVAAARRDAIEVSVAECCRLPPPRPLLIVVQALVKGERGELAVELLTEIGADEIVPWRAQRCVEAWRGDRAEKALTRWRSTARAAAKQARRAWHPTVSDPASTTTVAQRLRQAALGVVLHETATAPLGGVRVPDDGEIVVVVGPEGGLDDDELAVLGPTFRLGPTVLRASTAGTAAAAVLLARTARWEASATCPTASPGGGHCG